MFTITVIADHDKTGTWLAIPWSHLESWTELIHRSNERQISLAEAETRFYNTDVLHC